MTVVFITGNMKKLEQVQAYLGYPLEYAKLDLPEIQSLDGAEIATVKANEAFKQLGRPVMVDDVSLHCDAMNGFPGPLVKWVLDSVGPEGLCKMLDSYADRSATAVVRYGVHDGEQVRIFENKVRGRIASVPLGSRVFGWSPVFIPDGYDKTWGEVQADEVGGAKMFRAPVLAEVKAFLEKKGGA